MSIMTYEQAQAVDRYAHENTHKNLHLRQGYSDTHGLFIFHSLRK
jgi:hypothetical protein